MFTEQQEKWLKRVEELFLRYGIKSITMDDVARELGISKKTLYAFVENKDDLVNRVLERHIQEEKTLCDNLFHSADNAVDEMLIVLETNAQMMQQMKTNIVFDLQRYHREAWEKMEAYQRGFMYDLVRANLERGVREGLYRDNFDADIVAKLHIAATFQLFNESLFPETAYNKVAVFREYLMHYLYGIISEKGLEYLKAKLS